MHRFLSDDDRVKCQVVVNLIGEYSIWPQDDKLPKGWLNAKFSGDSKACLKHIDNVWQKN